jgi:hypothetical protein
MKRDVGRFTNRSTIGQEKNGLDSIETGATNGLHWPVHEQHIQIYSDQVPSVTYAIKAYAEQKLKA